MERFKELIGHYPEHTKGHAAKSEAVLEAFWEIAKEFFS